MIPKKVRDILTDDPRMASCEICGNKSVQWHHVFIYQNKAIQEPFAISAVCVKHHEEATPHNNRYKQQTREYLEWLALQRMTDEDLFKYPKRDWSMHAYYLSIQAEKYGW